MDQFCFPIYVNQLTAGVTIVFTISVHLSRSRCPFLSLSLVLFVLILSAWAVLWLYVLACSANFPTNSPSLHSRARELRRMFVRVCWIFPPPRNVRAWWAPQPDSCSIFSSYSQRRVRNEREDDDQPSDLRAKKKNEQKTVTVIWYLMLKGLRRRGLKFCGRVWRVTLA